MATFLKWNRIEEEANRAGVRRFLAKPLFASSIRNTIDELRGKENNNIHFLNAVDENEPKALDLSGKRILLTDDVDINRMIIIELLEDTNVSIDEAEDGDKALSMFEKSPEKYYDLVFMDIQMPGIDGYEATRRLRNLPRADAKTVPIIALTANAYKEDAQKAMEAGMNGHLTKPVDMDEVRALLAAEISPTPHIYTQGEDEKRVPHGIDAPRPKV
jgi:CheY-like chemotaxis protein